jgi:hypothetical protein
MNNVKKIITTYIYGKISKKGKILEELFYSVRTGDTVHDFFVRRII